MENHLGDKVQILEKKEIEILLKFLELTKDGNYAEIEDFSLKYSRLQEEPETINLEDNYYYSVS